MLAVSSFYFVCKETAFEVINCQCNGISAVLLLEKLHRMWRVMPHCVATEILQV